MNKYTKKITVFLVLLALLIPGLSAVGYHNNSISSNTAAAAGVSCTGCTSPGSGSPPGSNGDLFSFFYVSKSGSQANTLSICEWVSGPMPCTSSATYVNGYVNGGKALYFGPSGTSAGNTYTFIGKNGSGQVEIVVPTANPVTGGVYHALFGGNYSISISNFSSVISQVPPASIPQDPWSSLTTPGTTTSCGTPINSTATYDVNVFGTATGPVSLNNDNITIPYTLTNTSTGKQIATINSQASVATQDNNSVLVNNLNATFKNVPEGCYSVSSPDLTASPVTFSVLGGAANEVINGALNSAGQAAAAGAQAGSSAAPDDCNTSLFSLSWLLCPFVAALQAALTWLNNTIQGLLTLPVNSYFNDGCLATATQASNATGQCVATATDYGVWSNIRDISLALLVIAALIMVISTAIDVGPFDAYTVKKLLPRILIAVIAITFSWEIGRFLVQLSNDLGEGIGQLILSALPIHLPAGTSATNAHILNYIYNNNSTSGNGEGVIAWLAGGAVLGTLGLALVGPLALIMLILPAILAFLLGLLVLIARQLIVIMCVIFAPLAFMAFIMPGTQRVWKLWQQSFFGAIFLFPMITAVIAIGAFMAYLVMNGNINGYGTGIQPLLALVFLITPYFLIPRLARMSTGALGTISTGINNASQGAFKGIKQMQRNKMAQSWANIKAGQRFKGGNNENFRGRVNRAMRGATLLPKAGLRPTQMRTKMRQALRDASGGEQLEDLMQGKNRSFNTWSGDDAKLYASRFNSREDMAAALEAFDADRFGGEQNRARREEAVAQIQETKRQVNSAALAKARVRMQAKTGTGYQYVDENGQTQFDANAVLEDINEAYGNDRNGAADALAEVRTSLQQSGQMAGAAGFADWATALEDRHNNVVTGEQAHDRIMDAAIDAVTPGQAIYGKQGSAAALGHAHARRIQEIAQGVQAGTHTMDDLSAAMAGAAGIYDAMGQASPGNASAFANELFGEDVGLPPMSILRRSR